MYFTIGIGKLLENFYGTKLIPVFAKMLGYEMVKAFEENIL
jgi:hypothetical protein